jgi:hypothetical protein
MEKDFREVTEILFAKIGSKDLAAEIGCSIQTVNQARLASDSSGWRPPPPGWERAAKKLALQRATRLMELVASLNVKSVSVRTISS